MSDKFVVINKIWDSRLNLMKYYVVHGDEILFESYYLDDCLVYCDENEYIYEYNWSEYE